MAPVPGRGHVLTGPEESRCRWGGRHPSKTLERQVALLHALADAPAEGTSLRQLARLTDLAPLQHAPAPHRPRRGRSRGQRHRDPEVRLGHGILRLAGAVLGQSNPTQLVDPYLRRLTETSSFFSYATVWTGSAAVCVGTREPGQGGSFFVRIGRILPLHAAAAAKALICRFPEAELRTLLAPTIEQRFTDRTITNLEQLLADLRRGSGLGYWESDEELEAGVYAVAAPVVAPSGLPVMSLTLLCAQPSSVAARATLDRTREEHRQASVARDRAHSGAWRARRKGPDMADSWHSERADLLGNEPVGGPCGAWSSVLRPSRGPHATASSSWSTPTSAGFRRRPDHAHSTCTVSIAPPAAFGSSCASRDRAPVR